MLKGRLVSHLSMVTSMVCLEGTPMLASADDKGTVKLWDIRSLKCVQTLSFGRKTKINKLLNLDSKIAFIGSRLSYIRFMEHQEETHLSDEVYPVRVESCLSEGHLVVCTRRDVRFYDTATGKIKHIFADLFEDNEEIAIFRNVQNSKSFIIGNHKGELHSFSSLTGELLSRLVPHGNEVSCLRIDYENKIFVSAGWDSSVLIQREYGSAFSLVRELRNNFYSKEITFMEVSIFHNLIVIGSSHDCCLYVWDYEFAKLLMSIQFPEGE
jgi:WD40 repeat protein